MDVLALPATQLLVRISVICSLIQMNSYEKYCLRIRKNIRSEKLHSFYTHPPAISLQTETKGA